VGFVPLFLYLKFKGKGNMNEAFAINTIRKELRQSVKELVTENQELRTKIAELEDRINTLEKPKRTTKRKTTE